MGRVGEKAEAGGRLEAEAGQQKGRALEREAHLRICSRPGWTPAPFGCHGIAAGHGSVWGDMWIEAGSAQGVCLWVPGAGWRSWDPKGVTGLCTHCIHSLSQGFSPVITAPAPYQQPPVSAFSPRFAEGTKGRKGGLQGEAQQCKDLQRQRMSRASEPAAQEWWAWVV